MNDLTLLPDLCGYYHAVMRSAETIDNSFWFQSSFPAVSFGNCSWQWLLAQALNSCFHLQGSALRCLPLAVSPIVKTLGK